MASVRVHESYRAEFERRLDTLRESLSFVRDLVDRPYKDQEFRVNHVRPNVFIAGGCAAWLVGRFDEFDDIDVFLMNLNATRNMERYPQSRVYHTSKSALRCVVTINRSKEQRVLHKIQLCFFTDNGSKSTIREQSIWKLFDFDVVSTFINLFDTNVIYTTDCDTLYDSRCLVTNNGCVMHGKIVYPLLMNAAYFDFMMDRLRPVSWPVGIDKLKACIESTLYTALASVYDPMVHYVTVNPEYLRWIMTKLPTQHTFMYDQSLHHYIMSILSEIFNERRYLEYAEECGNSTNPYTTDQQLSLQFMQFESRPDLKRSNEGWNRESCLYQPYHMSINLYERPIPKLLIYNNRHDNNDDDDDSSLDTGSSFKLPMDFPTTEDLSKISKILPIPPHIAKVTSCVTNNDEPLPVFSNLNFPKLVKFLTIPSSQTDTSFLPSPLAMLRPEVLDKANSEGKLYSYVRPLLNHDRIINSTRRIKKYANRVMRRTEDSNVLDRPLSFLRVDNCLTERRDALTRRAFERWRDRTLSLPRGFGYRKCLRRFENQTAAVNDDRVVDILCTCKKH